MMYVGIAKGRTNAHSNVRRPGKSYTDTSQAGARPITSDKTPTPSIRTMEFPTYTSRSVSARWPHISLPLPSMPSRIAPSGRTVRATAIRAEMLHQVRPPRKSPRH